MKSHLTFLSLASFVISLFLFSITSSFSQDKNFVGIKTLKENGKVASQTITVENKSGIRSFEQDKSINNSAAGEKYVLGGTVLWSTQDALAIANKVAINTAGNSALTGWGLNNQRVSLYSDLTSVPLWNFSTGTYDPVVDISGDGSIIAATAGKDFYILDPTTGNINYQFTLPDSLYASKVSVSRDGSMAIALTSVFGTPNAVRVYAFDLSGFPSIKWTFDVPVIENKDWSGINFSASGSEVAITDRYHLYIFNSEDGTLIWDHFVENTQSPPAISGDGKVVCTADNSGFVQTWHFNSVSNEYDLLWQYHVPPGLYINWASSVGISADGSTIVAGSMITLSSGYDGSVMCFDTYGNGTPNWIYTGFGDLVNDISVSDDGKVAAAVSWGDYYQTLKKDLIVFDVTTGEPTFQVTTPGSFFTVDMNPEGSRVIAGGKAVHAREFGNGGRLYFCEIDLGGGNVNGNVDLTNTSDDSGVLVKALGTARSTITDINGDYTIENIPAGTYTISAG
jgi:hypothetical protein